MLETSHNSATIGQSREMVARLLGVPIHEVVGYIVIAVDHEGTLTFVSNAGQAGAVVAALTDTALEITRTYLPDDDMPFDPE